MSDIQSHAESGVYKQQGFGTPLPVKGNIGLLIVDFVVGFADPKTFGGGKREDVDLGPLKKGQPIAAVAPLRGCGGRAALQGVTASALAQSRTPSTYSLRETSILERGWKSSRLASRPMSFMVDAYPATGEGCCQRLRLRAPWPPRFVSSWDRKIALEATCTAVEFFSFLSLF